MRYPVCILISPVHICTSFFFFFNLFSSKITSSAAAGDFSKFHCKNKRTRNINQPNWKADFSFRQLLLRLEAEASQRPLQARHIYCSVFSGLWWLRPDAIIFGNADESQTANVSYWCTPAWPFTHRGASSVCGRAHGSEIDTASSQPVGRRPGERLQHACCRRLYVVAVCGLPLFPEMLWTFTPWARVHCAAEAGTLVCVGRVAGDSRWSN